ncbi:hypothetical protein TNCV_3257571 [Trichonephila clavipes]|nr:hypothetical protein TNCV_3257571 [Trichonephila clavipes]
MSHDGLDKDDRHYGSLSSVTSWHVSETLNFTISLKIYFREKLSIKKIVRIIILWRANREQDKVLERSESGARTHLTNDLTRIRFTICRAKRRDMNAHIITDPPSFSSVGRKQFSSYTCGVILQSCTSPAVGNSVKKDQ